MVRTDDVLLQKKANKEVLQPLSERIECTRKFLELFKPGLIYDLVPITDVAGPTGWDPNVQALVVSKETLSGASASKSPSTAAHTRSQPTPLQSTRFAGTRVSRRCGHSS